MTAAVDRLASVESTSLDNSRATRAVVAAVRVSVALLWIQNVYWKVPPDFGKARHSDLYQYVEDAVKHPVFAPYSYLVQHVVIPNFTAFGWMTLLVESSIGAFLLIGLATRFWALVGVMQSLAIALSVLKTPGEWHWSYYLMIIAHLALLAVGAGRVWGLDGVLRPIWAASPGRVSQLLARLS